MAVIVTYDDAQKFGDWSFTGLLQRNNVEHISNGTELWFPDIASLKKAERIWYDLSGSQVIGKFGAHVATSQSNFRR